MPGSNPHPVDIHVGSRVRLRRMMIGMSQEKLGDQLGVTFQQVQKYEKGANRIGASRLYAISRILGVPVSYFYEEMPEGLEGNPSDSPELARADESVAGLNQFVADPKGLRIALAFPRLSRRQQDSVVSLIESMGAES